MSDKIREEFEAWFESLNHSKPEKGFGPGGHYYLHQRVEDAWCAWQAAISQQPAPAAVPDGWQVVPKESTVDMEAAGKERASAFMTLGNAVAVYCAMLAAAPSAPAPAAQEPEYPPCDYCGATVEYMPWHGSGLLNGTESRHIHACDSCRHMLPAAEQPAAQEPGKLEKQLAEEERNHGLTIDQRDHAEEMATKLAWAIGEHFGYDVGEHSGANCPWENALELMSTAPPAAEQQECGCCGQKGACDPDCDCAEQPDTVPVPRALLVEHLDEVGEYARETLDRMRALLGKESV